MIVALLILIGLFLGLLGFFLLKKQEIFLTLLAHANQENQKFLATYGIIFLILAIIAFLISPFAQKEIALFFIAAMMLVSGLFSYQFSKRID